MLFARSWMHYLAVGSAVLTGVATGCSAPARVPDDATLIYLGPPNGAQVTPQLPDGAVGQLYVVDDKSGRLVAVRSIGQDLPPVRLNLDERRQYRAYLRAVGPTTNRSQ